MRELTSSQECIPSQDARQALIDAWREMEESPGEAPWEVLEPIRERVMEEWAKGSRDWRIIIKMTARALALHSGQVGE